MRWIKQISSGQRFVAEPEGTTTAPAVALFPRDHFPGGAERVDLMQNIDWAFIRRAMDAGLCVEIVVDLADVEDARQCAGMRIGFELASRLMPDGAIYLFRPGVPGGGGV